MFNSSYVIYGIIFLCALLLIEGIYYLLSDNIGRASTVNRRLQLLQSGQTTREVYETLLRTPPKALSHLGPVGTIFNWLDGMVTQAGIAIPTLRILMFMAGLTAVAALSVFVFAPAETISKVVPVPVAAAIASLLVGVGLPLLQIKMMKEKRLRKFSEQLLRSM